MDFIDLKTQYKRIHEDIGQRITTIFEHGQYIMGPEVREMEQKLADHVGVKHCLGVSSGTDALLVAMMAVDIKPGDEIITSPFSFFATVETMVLLGARPVFVDINPATYNLDAELLAAAITDKTRAIIPVSMYGQCSDMDTVNQIAAQHGLPVFEDGAQSFGATYKGRQSCGLSTVGCTSFFPSKPLGCYGDGGAVFTDDDDLAMIMDEIRLHGQRGRYNHERIGINGRMDTIQATVLSAKMEIFVEEVALRQQIGQRYTDELIKKGASYAGSDETGLKVPLIEEHNTSVYAQYTVQVPDREKTIALLKDKGVPTAVHYPKSLHKQPAIASMGYSDIDMPHSENAASSVVSLPMHPYLDSATQDSVIDALAQSIS